jgi:hypothetical protein
MPSRLRLLLLLSAVTFTQAQTQPTAKSPAKLEVTAAAAPAAPATEEYNRLPVQRVVLYKNGVGYFEHSARVRGKQELNIDFTTSQLNDVLKSLTVVDLGDGRISSVRYNSIAPLSERLKALRLPFGDQVDRDDFLVALRGARVEVHSGSSTATGKILSVDPVKKPTAKGDLVDSTEFSIITDSGEMRIFDLGPGTTVRLADHELNEEVNRYLGLISSSRSRDLRRMTISASGTGEREVFVSYISEVPVWKSTYRIILPVKANGKENEKENEKAATQPHLQGWAIVDNTIGEDWKDVRLSLVAGAPQSFIQEISQPFYTRRPVIALPQSVQLTPQTHEATLEEDKAPPPPAQYGGTGGGVGAGMGVTAGNLRAGGNGSLTGIVRDPTGAVVPGTMVAVSNDTGFFQTATSDAAGRYSFNKIPAGPVKVQFSSPGFKRRLSQTYIGANNRSQLDSQLNIGSTLETVSVGGPLMAETEDAMLSSALVQQPSENESHWPRTSRRLCPF